METRQSGRTDTEIQMTHRPLPAVLRDVVRAIETQRGVTLHKDR